ncbi:MAG: DUF5686 family protein [Paludibacter sp.]|nr:DUF5686 family protein [Paludibacter sp.]
MYWKTNFSFLFILISFVSVFFEANAQIKITGIVTDSLTGEVLPFISIQLKGSVIGTMTDNSGKFSLNVPVNVRQLSVSSIGYKGKIIPVRNINRSYLKIQLATESYTMSEVVVKPQKRKYTKKGNAAVDFVIKVIQSKERFDPYNKEYYSYQHDEQINIAINNFRKEKNVNLLKKYKFLTNYVDTSRLSGKPILPVLSKEKVEDYYYQKSPFLEKRVIRTKSYSDIIEMLPEDGVNQVLGETFKDVDIYKNNITLFLRPFVSPLSVGAPDFYKFYLNDTLIIAGDRCLDLAFVPITSQSPGFTGHLYITLDSTYFVKKVKLNFPRDINLNYIQDMSIEQEFKRAPDGTRLLMVDDMEVELSVFSNVEGFYARRSNRYSGHSFDNPAGKAEFNDKTPTFMANIEPVRPDSNWAKSTSDTIPAKVKSVGAMVRQLRKDPLYYYSEKILTILATGYVETSTVNNKITYGPFFSTLSTNSEEGVRPRIGGLTTANLNNQWFGNGYLAYGTLDKKVKYYAELDYSFDKKYKQANEFPIHSLQLSAGYEINWLGQGYSTTPDNVLLSLKRQSDSKMTYQRNFGIRYKKEYLSQFSYDLNVKYRTEYATQFLQFVDNGTGNNLSSFSLGEAELNLRYAPGEKIYQTPLKRYSITRTTPVFTLSHTQAFRNVLGSTYNYSHTEMGFQKKFWFSEFGNLNVMLRAGKVWSKNPFPLLIIPNANLSYTIQFESYATMNATEFINDQYLSWDLKYNLNGFLMNRIPLIQYLKLREIISFRGLYGSLSDRNDPTLSKGLFAFPAGSYRMGKEPYMEAGVGFQNIFKILSIDYVWRMTYLNHPNIDKRGFRVSLDFAF